MDLIRCPELFNWNPPHYIPPELDEKVIPFGIHGYAPILDFDEGTLELLDVSSVSEVEFHLYRTIEPWLRQDKVYGREYLGVYDFESNTQVEFKHCRRLNFEYDSQKFYTAYIQKKLGPEYQESLLARLSEDKLQPLQQLLIDMLGWGNFPWPPEDNPKYVCSCGNICAFIGKEDVVETNLLDNQGYINMALDRESKKEHKKVKCILCGKVVKPNY